MLENSPDIPEYVIIRAWLCVYLQAFGILNILPAFKLYSLSVCMCVCTHMCHDLHIEIRGTHGSCLLLYMDVWIELRLPDLHSKYLKLLSPGCTEVVFSI